MGYPRGLDEYSSQELLTELEQRRRDEAAGHCNYCHRDFGITPGCRMKDRHNSPELIKVNYISMFLADLLAPRLPRSRNPLYTATGKERRRRCPACGKLTRVTTAGCDHCDFEDK